MMIMKKKKTTKKNHDSQNVEIKRFLITVNVLGSSGPLRFVVNEDDKVSEVIDSSLKMYARGGRLPLLGFDFNKFLLYPSNAGFEVKRISKFHDTVDSDFVHQETSMKANEAIGSHGERTFVLCKKQSHFQMTEARSEMITRHRRSCGWKAWFKILSH